VKSRKSKSTPLGKVVFLLPILIIIAVVVYGYFQVTAPGTLKVEALLVNKYLPAGSQNETAQVSVTVGNTQGVTPLSLSLASGTYEVSFATILWYHTPPSKELNVENDHTVYATGAYDVKVDVIQITPAGFNTTSVTAEHGVTPVEWVNTSDSPVVFSALPSGTHTLNPSQNFTTIFSSSGDYQFTTSKGNSANSSGEVVVQ